MDKLFSLLLTISLSWLRSQIGYRVEKSSEIIFVYEGSKKEAPLFVVDSLAPGKCQDKTVVAINKGKVSETVVVRGTRMVGDSILGNSLDFNLSSGQNFYQGDLSSFMVKKSGVIMFVIPPRKQRKISMSICLPTDVDNSLQNKTVLFDLEFGTLGKNVGPTKKVPAKTTKN